MVAVTLLVLPVGSCSAMAAGSFSVTRYPTKLSAPPGCTLKVPSRVLVGESTMGVRRIAARGAAALFKKKNQPATPRAMPSTTTNTRPATTHFQIRPLASLGLRGDSYFDPSND